MTASVRRHFRLALAGVLAATTVVALAALPAAGEDVGVAEVPEATVERTLPEADASSLLGDPTAAAPGPVADALHDTGVATTTTTSTTTTSTTTTTTTPTTVPASGGSSSTPKSGGLIVGAGSTGRLTDPGEAEPTGADGAHEAAGEAPAFDGMGMVHAVEGDPFAAWGTGYVPTWGSRSTASILELLGAGATPEQVAKVLAPFPVAGPASYSDDWGAPRFTPAFHAHAGTDVFAARGTPVIASSDGTITRLAIGTAIGGTTVQLSTADGTYFYYAHLDAHAPGLAVGQVVAQGSVLGYVGTSGNAEGTPPHLHYEIHPQGGAAVPPVPYLDRWLADATARATGFAGAADPLAAEQFLTNAATARTPVVPIVPAARVGPLEIEPVADLQDPSGALVLIGAAAAALAWRRRRGMAQIATGRVHRRGLPRALSIPDAPAALLAAGEPCSFRLMPIPNPHLPTAPAPVATPALAPRLGGTP